MQLKEGFYRVRYFKDWQVAKLEYGAEYNHWYITGNDNSYKDKDWHEIDPNRIIMPDEKEDTL